MAPPDSKLSSLGRAQGVRRNCTDCKESLLPSFGSLVDVGVQGSCTVHHNGEELYEVPTLQQHSGSDLS